MRRQWNALTPSTLPSKSAKIVGYGAAMTSSTNTSYTTRLAAPPQRVGVLGDRLEPPAVAIEREAERHEVRRERLQAALEHQRSRHARVALEVAGEEPVIAAQRELGAQ